MNINAKMMNFTVFLDTISGYTKDMTFKSEGKKGTRRIMAGTLFETTQCHARATLHLLENQLHPSAFALQRILQESCIRANWILHCADDRTIELFQKNDKLIKANKQNYSIGEMIAEVESNRGWATLISSIKLKTWKNQNSFTHSGMATLSTMFDKTSIGPTYEPGLILDLIRMTSAHAFVAFLGYGTLANRADFEDMANDLLEKSKPINEP